MIINEQHLLALITFIYNVIGRMIHGYQHYNAALTQAAYLMKPCKNRHIS